MKKQRLKLKKSNDIRVVVVEDDVKVRNGLQWLINDSDGVNCVGACGTMHEALDAIDVAAPDVILLDIGLPDMSGIEGVRIIKQQFPHVQVLMVTVYSTDEMIFQALQAGAVGYILKKTSSDKIITAVVDAYNGGAPMSNEIARKVLRFFQDHHTSRSDRIELSQREAEVLKALVDGKTYKAIADFLFISINTVRFHLRNIYAKLHVVSRSEAIVKAIKEKLI